jgi:hypothetical protein
MKKRNAAPTDSLTEATFSACFVITVLLILPMLGSVAIMIGSVIGLALYVTLFPDRFRTRNGSLRLAIGLISFLALAAAVVVALSLTHQIK